MTQQQAKTTEYISATVKALIEAVDLLDLALNHHVPADVRMARAVLVDVKRLADECKPGALRLYHRISLLSAVMAGLITEEQAAAAYGVSLKMWRDAAERAAEMGRKKVEGEL